MYLEILQQNNLDYVTIQFVDRISWKTISSVYSAKDIDEFRKKFKDVARSSAENYSSGVVALVVLLLVVSLDVIW